MDVAIIGAGPAGLAAARALDAAGIRYVLLERGKPLETREHDNAEDLPEGVGGSGLFSDGKFSFYPSGTGLYRLADSDHLAAAYTWCVGELACVGIGSQPFPGPNTRQYCFAGTSVIKPYPSTHAPLHQRTALVRNLLPPNAAALRTHARVVSIRSAAGGYEVDYHSALNSARVGHEHVRALIVASGRFGGLALRRRDLAADIPLRTRRFEIGIRIESPASIGFLSRSRSPDVKQLWREATTSFRTFCTCRNGEVWQLAQAGLRSLSGRSDGLPTEYSNFGLLARFEGSSLESGGKLWETLEATLGAPDVTFEPIISFLGTGPAAIGENIPDRPWFPRERFRPGSIRARAGAPLYDILRRAVSHLLEWSPDLLDPRTICLFPAIEGVGQYPAVDDRLRIPGTRVWCAGDLAGDFRGLTPGLVSGYYAGLSVAEALRGERLPAARPSIH